MDSGIVKCFSPERGFGFIYSLSGELFFHWTGLNLPRHSVVNKGDAVEFEIVAGKKGQQAINISVTKPAAIIEAGN